MCPVLEYGSSVWDSSSSSVWDSSSILLQEELEKVQKRAARFVTANYIYETRGVTGILEQLKWESLKKKRRRDSRIIMLYKGLKGAASIHVSTNDLQYLQYVLAYKTLVYPQLEYASKVWSLSTKVNIHKTEMTQRCAAHWLKSNYSSYDSVTEMLHDLC